MSDGSKIEWTDATWNPITGCEIATPGCINCYAMRLAGTRLRNHPSRKGLTKTVKGKPVWNGKVRFNEEWLDQPLRWRRPRRIFVCAHGDLFYEKVPDEWIDKVFAVMALCPQHTFQVLTKRARRMREYLSSKKPMCWLRPALNILRAFPEREAEIDDGPVLPNVWLGISAERQKEADERIPDLLATPAAVRFVSAEPLIGPIDLTKINHHGAFEDQFHGDKRPHLDALRGEIFGDGEFEYGRGGLSINGTQPFIGWVIVGGESGPGHRPMEETWAAGILRQCNRSNTAAFMKQMSGKSPIPAHLMVREFPR